ncbi:MAG: hypothetical protein KGI60_00580 [Patescibacteria group bacterium]|nr:hypothetical protein [Patescibacteria group bacterium]
MNKKFFEELSQKTFKEQVSFFKKRILWKDTLPQVTSDGRAGEAPPEVVIEIITKKGYPALRPAAIEACLRVYALLLRKPLVKVPVRNYWGRPDSRYVAFQASHVVDVCGGIPEFSQAASIFLGITLATFRLKCLRSSAMRAAMPYLRASGESWVCFQLLDIPETAPYAFRLLLEMYLRRNEDKECVVGLLERIWRREVVDGWDIHTAFLAHFAQVPPDLLKGTARKMLDEFRAMGSKYEQKFVKSLDSDYSRHWLDAAP